ncbi:hypothetical protein BDV95DRAFT_599970 [Massariosphaeria phaeospora]|uniref:Uncharacterized protein n=1 Tax=Massariosphaeria phaeospora TaxID=100035 RepID=A0A7C8MB78_9PLEO|nr:hypothetical protein BDV95DRAFT_599970 [Massariosphaeria phaeospora]
MEFEVGPVRPEDMAQIMAVIFRAHRGENHYVNAVHPQNLTQDGQEKALKKLLSFTESSERSVWKKATTTTTGKIVGLAIWLVYETYKPVYTSGNASRIEKIGEEAEWAAALNASLARAAAPFWEENDLPLISMSTRS